MIETDMSRLASVYWSTGWLPTEPKLDFVIDNSSAPGSLAAAGAAITPVSSRTATPQRTARMISPLAQRNKLEGLALHAPLSSTRMWWWPSLRARRRARWRSMRAAAVGAGLGDDPLRPHRDRGLGVRRKRHVAPVATLEVDAPESPRSAVLATELRHLGAGRQQRRRAGVAKLVEIDLVAAGLAQQPAEPFALCVLIDAAGVDHKPIRLPLSVVSWPPARGPATQFR